MMTIAHECLIVFTRNSLFIDKDGFKRIDSNLFKLTTGDPPNMGLKRTCIVHRKNTLASIDAARRQKSTN
jgi:hypothetical protein